MKKPEYNIGDTVYYYPFGRVKSFVVEDISDINDGNPYYKDSDGNGAFENALLPEHEYLFQGFKDEYNDWDKHLTDSTYFDLMYWFDNKKGYFDLDGYSDEAHGFANYIWYKYIIPPKFKVGDEIEPKNGREVSMTITDIKDCCYYSDDLKICHIEDQDDWKICETSMDLNEFAKYNADEQFEDVDKFNYGREHIKFLIQQSVKAGAHWERERIAEKIKPILDRLYNDWKINNSNVEELMKIIEWI